MAELFVTIEPSGGDYTSLSACEAGENTAKDWVSDGDTGVWEVQGNWSGSPDSTATTIDGGTAGASNYVTIQANSANKAAAASSSLDTSLYIGPALDISDSFVRVIGLQFNSSMQMRDDCRIDSCKVISGAARALWPRGTGDTYALNCHASTAIGRGYEHDSSGDSFLYNCTVLDCPENIRIDAGTCKAINCLAQGATVGSDFGTSGGSFTSSSNNCSEDTSAPGTSAITSATVSFVSGAEVNSSDSTGVIGGGTDLSGDSTLPVTVDIDGTTRASSPTIGAFEVPSSGSVGAAAIALAASAASSAVKNSAGSSSVTVAAAGAGASLSSADGASALATAATGAGASTHDGVGASAVALAASAASEALFSGDGASAITMAAAAVSASPGAGAGSADIALAATAQATSTASADGAATIAAAASGVGASEASGAGASALSITAGAVGEQVVAAVGSAAVTSAAAGVGASTADSVAASSLTISALATGQSLSAGDGTATLSVAASAASGSPSSAAGSASMSMTASGVSEPVVPDEPPTAVISASDTAAPTVTISATDTAAPTAVIAQELATIFALAA